MDDLSTYLNWSSLLVFTTVLFLSYFLLRKRTLFPPGPIAFPLFGSVGFIRRLTEIPPHKAFVEASSRYGGVVSIWIGPKLFIVLNGYDTIRQAFVEQASDFIDRPNWIPQLANALKNGKGVSFSNGTEWKIMRKFALQSLREFGVGKGTIAERIHEEIEEISTALRNFADTPLDISTLLKKSVSNIMCNITFGQRFDYEDETFCDLLRNIDIALSGTGFISPLNFLPKCMHALFTNEHKIKTEREHAHVFNCALINGIIESHETTFDPTNIRDVIDLCIQNTRNDSEFSKNEYFHKGNMFRLINDLFLAGSETTATSLNWLFLHMIEYPDIQTRCRKAIQKQVGDRHVRLSDRPALAYIEATINEVLRCSNVVPLGVPRTCVDHDISINGYTIPRRTLILANLYSANTDPKYWDTPSKFNPERFLDANGTLIKHEAFIPMSLGPRNCLGESLARLELFLIFSNLLQRFEFHRENQSIKHDFSLKKGKVITLVPEPYKLKCVPII